MSFLTIPSKKIIVYTNIILLTLKPNLYKYTTEYKSILFLVNVDITKYRLYVFIFFIFLLLTKIKKVLKLSLSC